MVSRACRLVPTNRMRLPCEATSARYFLARSSPRIVSRTSMMWMRLRRAYIYGRIFGFQRLERWPKWTPDSTNSLTRVVDTNTPDVAHRLCVARSARSGGDRPALARDFRPEKQGKWTRADRAI